MSTVVMLEAGDAVDNSERRKATLRWRLRKMIEDEGLTIREVLYLRDEDVDAADADVDAAVMLEAGKPVCLALAEAAAAVDDPYGDADADAAAAAEDNSERRKAMLHWRLRKMIEDEGLTIREVLYLR